MSIDSARSIGAGMQVMRRDVAKGFLLALVGEPADSLSRAAMLLVQHTERRLVNHRQSQRSAYFRDGKFLSVQKKIPVQVTARLEISPAEDEESSVRGVNDFAFTRLYRRRPGAPCLPVRL